ncbi:hypothetical protein NLM31_36695 [Bradyrhizobium sp. CCGUVB4N]|uniref:hypothetical protein n=1 Tax=Bradyrhizobium sp. CCGUVB4N TaxID=2949631 RepID=UPI0020B21D7A|nr:hypothetical protein [Bradyrhizobium sp. CCGUVB4N]MCP3385941.1 hypothetical protein [Bradyrhizobium sp. CCGUVB4N]
MRVNLDRLLMVLESRLDGLRVFQIDQPDRSATQSALATVLTSIGPGLSINASMADELTGLPRLARVVGWDVCEQAESTAMMKAEISRYFDRRSIVCS